MKALVHTVSRMVVKIAILQRRAEKDVTETYKVHIASL